MNADNQPMRKQDYQECHDIIEYRFISIREGVQGPRTMQWWPLQMIWVTSKSKQTKQKKSYLPLHDILFWKQQTNDNAMVTSAPTHLHPLRGALGYGYLLTKFLDDILENRVYLFTRCSYRKVSFTEVTQFCLGNNICFLV